MATLLFNASFRRQHSPAPTDFDNQVTHRLEFNKELKETKFNLFECVFDLMPRRTIRFSYVDQNPEPRKKKHTN